MSITITNSGGQYKVVRTGKKTLAAKSVGFEYDSTTNKVDIKYNVEGNIYFDAAVPVSDITFGTTNVTNESEFWAQHAVVFRKAGTSAIPTATGSMFYLDGSVEKIGANYYFTDKTGNGRAFLITGYDFDTDWVKGFPYKSAATISAPAGDAALISADINSYLYTSGTPNQIPVVSLFQDIDFEHKIFTRHLPAVSNPDGVELISACVIEVIMYSAAKSGADLTSCQSYFSVPVEQAGAVYLKGNGSDANPSGTKEAPWRSIDKIKSTSATVVYLLSGDYTPAALVNLTGNAVSLIGTGLSKFTLHTTSFGLTFTRPVTCKGLQITNSASTYGINMSNDVTFDFCKLINAGSGKFITTQVAAKNLVMNNTIGASTATGDGIHYAFVAFNSITMTGCYLVNTSANPFYVGIPAGTYLQQNTRMKGVFASNGTGDILGGKQNGTITGSVSSIRYTNWYGLVDITATNNLQIKNNTFSNAIDTISLRVKAANNAAVTGVKVNDNYVSGNRNSSYILFVGGAAGEQGFNAINGLEFLRNTVVNTSPLTTGTCHTVFIGGGIDNKMKWNDLTVPNGYGIVVKAAGRHYTTADAHVSYNIIRCTGTAQYLIYNRGTWGLICSNNTLLNHSGGAAIRVDDDSLTYDNSMLCINNVITLAANISASAIDYTSAGITSRNNVVIKNGFTTAIATGANDLDATISFNLNGVPATRIDNGEVVAGDNATGLASDYSALVKTFKVQDDIWQKGAIVK